MIFLDNHSTTAIHPDVLKAMNDSLSIVGNPHSTSHFAGRMASQVLDEAKETIGSYFGVSGDFVVLTSGATEANNLAILGGARKMRELNPEKQTGFISPLEHKCVANSAQELVLEGITVETLPYCPKDGVNLDFLSENISKNACFVSIMAANNETSDEINFLEAAKIASAEGVFFHSDFSQAMLGKDFDLTNSGVTAISISGHKFQGPMGVGALICSQRPSEILKPLLHGGLQEEGVRSGTVPVFLAVGLAKAIELVRENKESRANHLNTLVDAFLRDLEMAYPKIEINSKNMRGRPGGVNIHAPNIDAEELCLALSSDISVSSSAACTGTGISASETLLGMGYDIDRARQSIRLCFAEQHTIEEAKFAANKIASTIGSLSD